jgi:hypothetical protein
MERASFAALVAVLLLAPAAGLSQPTPAVGVGGTVVDRSGSPVEGVSVVAYDANNNVAGSAVTGPGGRFLIPLTTGTYTLKLSKPGYVEKTVQFTVGKGSFYTELGTIVLDYSVAISLPLASLSLPVLGVATVPVTVSNRGSSPENITLEIGGNCSLSVGLYSGSVQVGSLLLNPGDAQSLTLKVEGPVHAERHVPRAAPLLRQRRAGAEAPGERGEPASLAGLRPADVRQGRAGRRAPAAR